MASIADKKKAKAAYRKYIVSIPINPKVLHLACEWEECSASTENMDDFIQHVSEHLSQLVSNITLPEQVLGCFNCKWRKCNVAVIGHISDFTRHVYFHTFHTKIKSTGSLLIQKLSLQPCKLDGQSCNLIPDLPERLQCGWIQCGAIYDNPEYFYRHVDFHAANVMNGYRVKDGCGCEWEGCDVYLKTRHKLLEHLRSHTQQKLVACPNCGGLFANRTKFFDHLKKQTDAQLYQCSHCKKKFQTERLLRDHIRIHVNSYKCPLCEMTCPNPHGLRNHLLYKHTTEKQFKCPKCEYKAKTQFTLNSHMEIHSENVLMCHEKGCEYVTRLYQGLANHYQKVHQGISTRQYECHVCKQRFSRGTFLTKHLQKHHNYKWPPGYSRFRYMMHSDGLLRLQMVRYESVNLIEQDIDMNALQASNFKTQETSGELEQKPSTAEDDNKTFEVVPTTSETLMNAGAAAAGGGGSEEVNITYNLEMLGDVALLNPNKLEVHAKQVVTTDCKDEEMVASPGDEDQMEMYPDQNKNPNSLVAMEQPSTSSLRQIQHPSSAKNPGKMLNEGDFLAPAHEDDEDDVSDDDDNHSSIWNLF